MMTKKFILKRSRFLDIWLPFTLVLIPIFVLGVGIPFYLDQGLNIFSVGWFLIGIYLFVHQIIFIQVYFSTGEVNVVRFYKMEGVMKKMKQNKFLAQFVPEEVK